MLTRIRLENFKSWRELDMELAPLTLLFGTNSSGKSSVLQALLLLKQTANSFERINFGGGERDYFDFGSYRDLVFSHDLNLKIALGIDWLERDLPFQYEIMWKYELEKVMIEKMVYRLEDGLRPELDVSQEEDDKYRYTFSTRDGKSGFLFADAPKNCYLLPEYLNLVSSANSGFDKDTPFLAYVLLFRSLIDNINYLGPLREHPRRTYGWSGYTPDIVGIKGENTVAVLMASRRNTSRILENVSEWLSKMRLIDSFDIVPLDPAKRFYEAKVRIGAAESSLLDVGFGVSQVLPVITMLLTTPEGSIVLLEQPELHLHPGAQAHLADLLLQVAEERHLQLIVESHSEHLLRRIQRRIAEPEHAFANPDNIRMYFCQPGADGSQIEQVQVDKYGQIANWPDNFFGDLLADLDAMTDAALARRRQELNGG